jgi:hypothetical protein
MFGCENVIVPVPVASTVNDNSADGGENPESKFTTRSLASSCVR